MLEKERLKRGWTQNEVALKVGVARPTYANYEKGKREPDFETSQKLADLFETTIDYLLGKETKYDLLNEETEEDRDRRTALELLDKIHGEDKLRLALGLLEQLAKE